MNYRYALSVKQQGFKVIVQKLLADSSAVVIIVFFGGVGNGCTGGRCACYEKEASLRRF